MLNLERARNQMVDSQIARRGVRDRRVLEAMREVPRELFIDPDFEKSSYEDTALPIGQEQTIPQPYIVALMAEAAELASADRVLEVGTGSGYAAAVLSQISNVIHTIERHAVLGTQAQQCFNKLGYGNISLRVGDGTQGWPEAAPFDATLVTASGSAIPAALKQQLAIGGRLIIPLEEPAGRQILHRVRRLGPAEYREEILAAARFRPLICSDNCSTGAA